MVPLPEDLDISELRRRLDTRVVGDVVLRYERLGSTSDVVRQAAQAGQPEGLVVLTEEQTAGRGRLGRGWVAPFGSALLLSVLLRPTWAAPSDSFLLTMLGGTALCEAIEQATPLRAQLKWPNDVMLGAPGPLRKAAGILTELSFAGDGLAWAIVGIGVNVNEAPTGVVDGRDLAAVATSVAAAAGGPVSRAALLQALIERLDEHYASLRRGGRDEIFAAWRGRLAGLGEQVTVRLPHGELRGLAEGVEPDGALRLRDAQGEIHLVTAGDIGIA